MSPPRQFIIAKYLLIFSIFYDFFFALIHFIFDFWQKEIFIGYAIYSLLFSFFTILVILEFNFFRYFYLFWTGVWFFPSIIFFSINASPNIIAKYNLHISFISTYWLGDVLLSIFGVLVFYGLFCRQTTIYFLERNNTR